MVVTPVRLSRAMRAELDRLVTLTGVSDRSALVRRMLADGIRRAHASSRHPALLPDDLRPPAGPPA